MNNSHNDANMTVNEVLKQELNHKAEAAKNRKINMVGISISLLSGIVFGLVGFNRKICRRDCYGTCPDCNLFDKSYFSPTASIICSAFRFE